MAHIQRDQSNDNRPLVAELCRMLWLAFGPAGLFFTGVGIWKLSPWTYTYLDGLFWGLAFLTVAARFLDVRVFRGTTTENRTATMSDFWRYALALVAVAVLIWALAQSYQA